MVEGDVFREVEEEMRRERMKALWDRFGTYIVAAALAIVLGVSGYKGWQYYSNKKAAEAGSRFEGALVLEQDGKKDESLKALRKIAADGPEGYRALAAFRLAGDLADSGKKAEAVAEYDKLAKQNKSDPSLANFAAIRAALLRVDEADWDEMQKRLEGMTGGESAWRHSARELLGLSAYRNGKKAAAEKVYNEILVDTAASNGLRQRAQLMLGLIVEPQKADASSSDGAVKSDASEASN
ncbi:MAG: tetratricopeptide repeat protein [Hyphomicrobiaceae bacterium]